MIELGYDERAVAFTQNENIGAGRYSLATGELARKLGDMRGTLVRMANSSKYIRELHPGLEEWVKSLERRLRGLADEISPGGDKHTLEFRLNLLDAARKRNSARALGMRDKIAEGMGGRRVFDSWFVGAEVYYPAEEWEWLRKVFYISDVADGNFEDVGAGRLSLPSSPLELESR